MKGKDYWGLNEYVTEKDVVYVFEKKENTGWIYFMIDFLYSYFLDSFIQNTIEDDKTVFLVASEDRGLVIVYEMGKIREVIEIKEWKKDFVETFNEVKIGKMKYIKSFEMKKIKKGGF